MSEIESFKLPVINKPSRTIGKIPQTDSHGSYQPGLIIVRYGDDKKMILNSFCQTMHLLNRMRKVSGCHSLDHIDLMSWGAGEIQNISRLRYDYAHRFLRPRETYLLVRVIDSGDRTRRLPHYTSLLKNLEQLNPDLAGKLEQLSKPGKAQKLKSKWSNLSKKGMDFMTTERQDNKYTQNSNSSSNKVRSPKEGRQGLAANVTAARERDDKSRSLRGGSGDSSKRLSTEGNGAVKRVTKLPPLSGY